MYFELMFGLICGIAFAARITVDASGSGDYEDIGDALAAAAPGDFIVVLAGEYGSFSTSNPVPIIGLDGRDQTWADTPTVYAPITIEGISFEVGSGYATFWGGSLRRVGLYGDPSSNYHLYNRGDLSVQGSVLGGSVYGLYTYSADVQMENTTLVGASNVSLYAYYGAIDAENLLVSDGSSLGTCSSGGTITIDHGLYDGSNLPNCGSTTAMLVGFPVDFASRTSSTSTFRDDDLSLQEGSLAVEAGDCAGTACDLGYTGWSWQDDDDDGLPDGWEQVRGLDPTLADGSLDDDGDGLENLGEYLYGTDPLDDDTDQDGVGDLDELLYELDPLDPTDQAPTASLYTTGTTQVGSPIVVDGTSSSDPTGDPLSYSWTLDSAPEDSQLPVDLGSSAVLVMTPDVVGSYTVELTVDDGTQNASATTSIVATWGGTLHIPSDFATLADARPYLGPGVTVHFEAGTHSIGDFSLQGLGPITFEGEGIDQTFLNGTLRVYGSATLRDLSLENPSGLGIQVLQGDLTLRDVRVVASSTALYVYDGARIWGWGVEVEAHGGYALYSYGGTSVLGHSRLDGYYGTQLVGSTRLSGVAFHSDASYGLVLGSWGHAENLTVSAATGQGLYLSGLGRVEDILVHDTGVGVSCTSVAAEVVGIVLGPGISTASSGCVLMRDRYDEVAIVDGVPAQGSIAWDGGNPFEFDPDGTRRDVGATGGPAGLQTEHGLENPDEDADGDGIAAVHELVLGTSDSRVDSDSDGITDRAEVVIGSDPADPSDHHPAPADRSWRVVLDAELEIRVTWVSDPDGESCSFAWEDGQTSSSRSVATDVAGSFEYRWTLSCGAGAYEGVSTVLVEERVRVPEDVPSLQEALDGAEAHHRVVVGEGSWSATGHYSGLAIEGADEGVVVEGDLLFLGEAQLSDLLVLGNLSIQSGSLNRLGVFGSLETGDVSGRNILVDDGGFDVWQGGTFANVTVDGWLTGPLVGIRSSAVTGEARIAWDAIDTDNLWGFELGEHAFIHEDEDPWLAILEPWPGSSLWDAGSQQTANQDVDGSREDIGHTGGPAARIRDADGDHIADAWEELHGVDDPSVDLDNDSLINSEEWALNTHPKDADTDDDRLFDAEDPYPLDFSGHGLFVALLVDDRMPRPLQPVVVSLAVDDPAAKNWSVEWSLEAPPGSQATGAGQQSLRFIPDLPGSYRVSALFGTEDGYEQELSVDIHTRREQAVSVGSSLELAVQNAEPGTALVLEGPFIFSGTLVVDKDLLITQEHGALHGGIEGIIGAPAITVTDNAHLVLEAVTLRPAEGETGIHVTEGSSVELRQARIVGGFYALWVEGGRADLKASQVIGAESLLYAYRADVALRNCVVGYPEDEELEAYAWSIHDTNLLVQGSIVDWRPAPLSVACGWGCEVIVDRSLLVDPLDEMGLLSEVILDGDPDFLLSPLEAAHRGTGDLRLATSSPAVDAGPDGDPDADGSPNDMGAFGGRWGDWPDVDNDRDGWTNLEGDCNDLDPSIHPDWTTGECPEPEVGCKASPRHSSWGFAGLLALGLVGARRRR